MIKEAILVLEDGSVYHGYAFSAEDSTYLFKEFVEMVKEARK